MNDYILIVLLIIIGFPMIKYDFRLLIVILIGYMLIFPEKRIIFYQILGLDKLNTLNINQPKLKKTPTTVVKGIFNKML